jgi:hypothetical protein
MLSSRFRRLGSLLRECVSGFRGGTSVVNVQAIVTMPAATFESHVYRRVEKEILSWKSISLKSAYAISFFCDFGDTEQPLLKVSFNTDEQVAKAMEGKVKTFSLLGRKPQPPKEDEAKWNYAFWTQTTKVTVGDPTSDGTGFRLCEAWRKERDLRFGSNVSDDKLVENETKLKREFMNLCARVAKKLHDEGIINKNFGRNVPVIIHELEYYDLIAECTKRANPGGIADEFTVWVENQ